MLKGKVIPSGLISDAEINELDKDIFPFWQDKVLTDYAEDFTSPLTAMSLLGRFDVFLLTEAGGMEMQLNVLDPKILEDARLNPGKYPELVVRVSGYCAYFDDLPDAAKLEIIARTRLEV